MDNRKKSLCKAISWRLIGSASTFAVSATVTSDFRIASGIMVLEFFVKIAIFYLHERLWTKINLK